MGITTSPVIANRIYQQKLVKVFYNRPRLLNLLHAVGLAVPHSQTNAQELYALQQYASGKSIALKIGTYMGVSASVIAKAMNPLGKLYCVDLYPLRNGRENSCQTKNA